MTSPFQRHEEITIEEYVTFDDDLRRSIEVIDGVAFIIEHYALVSDGREYLQVGISHRDRDHPALNLTAPFPYGLTGTPWK